MKTVWLSFGVQTYLKIHENIDVKHHLKFIIKSKIINLINLFTFYQQVLVTIYITKEVMWWENVQLIKNDYFYSDFVCQKTVGPKC